MSARTKRQKSWETYRFLCGSCPDEECKARLYFPSYDKSVECTGCGQRHEKSLLRDVAEVTNPEVAIHNLLKNILLGNRKPKKGADNVKVLGLSNYLCKLISPILTSYGMDRKTGKARLLKELGQDEVLNCGKILGNRAFLIEEENLDIIGYGRDRSGSLQYLADTLDDIKAFNNNETRLVPIHADGDGHCLVHAISRALVGRELFWHALRVNLGQHIRENLDNYKLLFQNFVDSNEWDVIIEECDPYYIPPEGEPIGLRNIHIFGLANILHRPIILLDSKSGMQSFGDYSGVFLPGFVKPQDCRSKEGVLNKPLCIAWSSSGRNHYIPLVGVKGTGEVYLPSYMVQKAWGMPKEEIKKYIEFDHMYRCTIGGDKCLTDKYVRQLVGAMEEIFMEQYHVHPSLVADVHQFIYKSSGIVGVQPTDVIERTQQCVSDKLLYRCLTCDALMEYHVSMEHFEKGGALYNLAVNTHKKLDPTKLYSFPTYGAVCSYDKDKDVLVPDKERSQPNSCVFCNGQLLRLVKADGSIQYVNGDRTTTPSVGGKCVCGYKHYWDGEEFDNLPEQLPISLQWGGKLISESVAWFQYETDPTKNSNVFEVAQKLVQKHFPGEFGSERLVQRVVDTILAQTAVASRDDKMEEGEPSDVWSSEQASKIILTGHKHKTLHKEELTKSEAEKGVRKKIQTHAPQVQQKKTLEIHAQKTKSAVVKDTKTSQPKPHPEAPSTSQSVPGTSQPSNTSSEKKVRLATSDGRQAMLTLVSQVTFSELQKLIYQAVDVPADRQKIRMGFPPKILEPPGKEEEETVIPLQHGDKIALEILPDPYDMKESVGAADAASNSTHSPPHNVLKQTSWNSFDENIAQNQSAETLLNALKNVQQTGSAGDSIDASIASMTIMSAVTGKDLWTYVQGMPHLFSVGGLFYKQVERDLGLTEGKHCQLPCLPGKIFRYTSKEDRLELCLEPYGHFPIEPNIEQKVMDRNVEETHEGSEVKFGASGAVRHGAEHKAFQGQGHSLKAADTRMPIDLACADRRPHARGFRDLCVPGHHEDSITEEPEGDQMEAETIHCQETNPSSSYQRLGPGFSMLDPVASNTANSNVEMFRALAESLEKSIERTMSEDTEQEEISNVDTRIPPMGLFESIMATQSKQTVTMHTGENNQSNLSDKQQTVTMDTHDDTRTNENTSVSMETVENVQSDESVKGIVTAEGSLATTTEATESPEKVMQDNAFNENISDMKYNKDLQTDKTETEVMDTENAESDTNKTDKLHVEDNVVEMSRNVNKGDINTGSAIDKLASDVTMEIVEETLNTMETDKTTEPDTKETELIDSEMPAAAGICADTDSKETLADSENNQPKGETKTLEKDKNMDGESEMSSH